LKNRPSHFKLEKSDLYNGESEFFNPGSVECISTKGSPEMAKIAAGMAPLLREAASLNEHEFFCRGHGEFRSERPKNPFLEYHPALI